MEALLWGLYRKIFGYFMLDPTHYPQSPREIYAKHKELIDSTFRPYEIDSPGEWVLTKLYWITLFAILSFSVALIFSGKFKKDLEIIHWNYKLFLKFFFLMLAFQLWLWNAWGILLINYDPNYPTWNFFPWSVFNYSFLGQTLEDWLFYPICFIFSCVLFVKAQAASKRKLDWRKSRIILDSTYGLLLLFFDFFLSFGLCK